MTHLSCRRRSPAACPSPPGSPSRSSSGRRGSSTATRSPQGQARRGAPGALRPGARRHRYRDRRRADAAPFRDDVHRGPGRRRLRAQEDRAHPQPLRRRRAGRRSARSRAGIRSTSTTRRSCAAQRRARVKYTLPGPMTMVDTLYDAHYEQPREARMGVRRDPERGSARDRRGGRRRDPVRRAGVQRLFRRSARLGRRRRSNARRRASPARPPCTSATATASRPTSTGRRRWAPNGANTSRPSAASPQSTIDQVSLECANSHVPIELIGLLAGKDVLVGAIDVATRAVETPDDVARDDPGGACAIVPAERLYPCTNCGMVPLARATSRAASSPRWALGPPSFGANGRNSARSPTAGPAGRRGQPCGVKRAK